MQTSQRNLRVHRTSADCHTQDTEDPTDSKDIRSSTEDVALTSLEQDRVLQFINIRDIYTLRAEATGEGDVRLEHRTEGQWIDDASA
ncbi:hypothetical protein C8039_02855 [Halogeometricum sp. wsp3]|nr:hypothetical protein C8039_02855 [Halogeometricum sp. wsp3]